jgi:hypothetical protein
MSGEDEEEDFDTPEEEVEEGEEGEEGEEEEGGEEEEDEVNNNYEYSKYIKTPKDMGIEVGENMSNIENGVAGIFSYVKLLVEGKSNASKTGKPLGNKYFLETQEDCIVEATNEKVKRSLYFDNVPSGTAGMITDTGDDFSEFRGLVPGIIENVMSIGKIDFFSAFTQVGIPKCLPVKLKTIDVNNKESTDTQYVIISDIKDISPCNFASKLNPVSEESCTREDFTLSEDDKRNAELYKNYYKLDDDDDDHDIRNKSMKLMMPDDIFLKILFFSLGALSIYIAIKLLANMYKKRH